MCTAMAAADEGATHTVTLSVPSTLAPLTLAFVICVTPPAAQADTSKRPPRRHFITPLHGRHFSALIGTSGGSAARQGATLESSGSPAAAPGAAPAPGPSSVLARAGGAAGQQQQQQHTVNFAVRCRGVDRVSLVLLRPHGVGQGGEWGMLEVVLDPVLNRSGDMWHVAGALLHADAVRARGWWVFGGWWGGCVGGSWGWGALGWGTALAAGAAAITEGPTIARVCPSCACSGGPAQPGRPVLRLAGGRGCGLGVGLPSAAMCAAAAPAAATAAAAAAVMRAGMRGDC